MLLRSSFRNVTLRHIDRGRFASNYEIFEEIRVKNMPTLSEIGTVNFEKYQGVGRGHIREINDCVNSKPSLRFLRDLIPASILKPSTIKKRVFLVEKDIACDIMKVLRPHFETYSGHVIEINAGVGILTEELFKAKVQNLRIYEADAVLCNHILKLKKQYQSDARLFVANLTALPSVLKADAEDGGRRTDILFDGLPSLNWQDEPTAKLIGALPSDHFILHTIFSVAFQSGFCKYGRPELYMFLPPEVYKKLTSKPSDVKMYKGSSVTFQIMFDHEKLTEVPEKAFFPWCIEPRTIKGKNQSEDISDHIYLVKMSPKRDLLETIPLESLRTFLIFVKLLMHKKSALLIDIFETWIPGSGVRLIAKGYTIFTDCGSLTPEEYLKLYLEFTSWPEYHSSSFLLSAENFLSKVLRYNLEEESMTDGKVARLLNKENKAPDSELDVFDDSTNLERKDRSC